MTTQASQSRVMNPKRVSSHPPTNCHVFTILSIKVTVFTHSHREKSLRKLFSLPKFFSVNTCFRKCKVHNEAAGVCDLSCRTTLHGRRSRCVIDI